MAVTKRANANAASGGSAKKAGEDMGRVNPVPPTPHTPRGGSLSCWRRVYVKLFTREDPVYFHKVFGALALASFVYRYAWCFAHTRTLGFNGTALDWWSLLAHLMLSSSSLIFHVLPKRIIRKPGIIWEEYRLHAIVFTTRCMLVCVCGYVFACVNGSTGLTLANLHGRVVSTVGAALAAVGVADATGDGSDAGNAVVVAWLRSRGVQQCVLLCTVATCHLVADYVTARFGKPGESTVRGRIDREKEGLRPLKPNIWWLTRFYAFYQISAVISHIIPSPRTMDLGYNTLIAIQSSAFLMTLFRKGLIAWYWHAIGYTLCLVISMFHVFHVHDNLPFFVVCVCVFVLRVVLRVNKYALWIAASAAWYYAGHALAAGDREWTEVWTTTTTSMRAMLGA